MASSVVLSVHLLTALLRLSQEKKKFPLFNPAGRESLSGGALPPCGKEVRSLRSGVTVASTQPFGQGLQRVQVCPYHADVIDVSRPRSLPSRAQDGFL